MTTYIIEYFDNTDLPKYLENQELIKFKGFKNNGKAEGPCTIGYIYKYGIYHYEEVNFINDKKNGPYKIYDYNVDIWEEGIYINNLKNGPYKTYDEDGYLIEEGIYKNDKNEIIIE